MLLNVRFVFLPNITFSLKTCNHTCNFFCQKATIKLGVKYFLYLLRIKYYKYFFKKVFRKQYFEYYLYSEYYPRLVFTPCVCHHSKRCIQKIARLCWTVRRRKWFCSSLQRYFSVLILTTIKSVYYFEEYKIYLNNIQNTWKVFRILRLLYRYYIACMSAVRNVGRLILSLSIRLCHF